MDEVYLFNSLTRSVELLAPLEPGKIKLYCCGPTVYNYQHIGNLRTYIFEDTLVRMLKASGYKITHVMNITDVGHLASDSDEGEDKMLLAAKREGKSSHEIANYYTKVFFDHCKQLNIHKPDIICKATDHIKDMIDLISLLQSKGFAYRSGGNVYFDVKKFPNYGQMAKLDLKNLRAGARAEIDKKKKNPLDFTLWFTDSKFKDQQLQWESPWGRGYPGWHIECSAMAKRFLGKTIDIHCGGIDHIPIHHTNEIAQSESAHGCSFAKVWMHGAFLTLGEEKMSKSTEGFLTLDALKEKNIDPLAYRLFCYSARYRKELSFNWDALRGADQALKKIRKSMEKLREETTSNKKSMTVNLEQSKKLKRKFLCATRDDMNMPEALSIIYTILKMNDVNAMTKLQILGQCDEILGLELGKNHDPKSVKINDIPQEIREIAQKREGARKQKNWPLADELREKISSKGFNIQDTPQGPIIQSTADSN